MTQVTVAGQPEPRNPNRQLDTLILSVAAWVVAIAFVLWNLQNPAYKKWQSGASAAMFAHRYNLRRDVILFVAFVVLSTMAFTALGVLASVTS